MSNKIRQARAEKLEQIRKAKEATQSALEILTTESSGLAALQSVSLGLYEELDKLTKKAPAEAVTDFVLSQLNDVVSETKKLAVSDAYVQKLHEVVAAGDNPEQRDALVILRQARQGLERHKAQIDPKISILRTRLGETSLLENAVQTFLADGSAIKKDDDIFSGRHYYPDWFYSGFPYEFNFQRLDSMDILAHFNLK